MTLKFDPVAFEESGRLVRAFLDARKQREWRAAVADRCTEIADRVVPQYRTYDDDRYQPGYSCTGHVAKRWQAAWDGACIALGGDPAEYRR